MKQETAMIASLLNNARSRLAKRSRYNQLVEEIQSLTSATSPTWAPTAAKCYVTLIAISTAK